MPIVFIATDTYLGLLDYMIVIVYSLLCSALACIICIHTMSYYIHVAAMI